MTAAADVFPGNAQTLLHLGSDPFDFKIFDKTVTRDDSFVSVNLGGEVKLLTRYPADLCRLAQRLKEAADQLQEVDGNQQTRQAAADLFTHGSVLR